MTFTTFTFLIFLVFVFSLYWLLKGRTQQNILLVISSYCFYAWWDYRFCALMLIASLVDFSVGLGLSRTQKSISRKALLLTSILCNLGMLGFFKYFDFFAQNFAAMLNVVGFKADQITLRLILPVGISFYTFQTMSYTIDCYRGKIAPTRRIIDYMAYVSFFPQLVAGPIERATNLLPQFNRTRNFDCRLATDGLREIMWGFFKKMVIADNIAIIVNTAYAAPASATGMQMALATFCFAFQIYCDFSAYSHIAIGTAKLFGFSLMRNFAYPYFSQSLTEFWRRWHISLSTWFRDYVYIPLGGSRIGSARRAMNLMITFLICGLWHGASWNFVIWGGISGGALLFERIWKRKPSLHSTDKPGSSTLIPSLATTLRMLLTFSLVSLAWVFFRARNLSDSMLIISKISKDIFSLSAGANLVNAIIELSPLQRGFLLILVLTVLIEWIQRAHPHPLFVDHWPRPLRWALYTSLIWSTLLLCAIEGGDFIYFQF